MYVLKYICVDTKAEQISVLLPADAFSSLCKYLNAISAGYQNKNSFFYSFGLAGIL